MYPTIPATSASNIPLVCMKGEKSAFLDVFVGLCLNQTPKGNERLLKCIKQILGFGYFIY